MKRRLIPFAAGLAALMLATPSLAKTNLRLWTFDSGTKLMPIQKAIDAFIKDNPHYTVKLESVGGGGQGYNDKLVTALAADSPPDVFQINEYNAAAWAIRGFLEPLEAYAKESRFNLGDISKNVLAIHKNQGKTYGLPKDFASLALYYNKDILDSAGVPVPKDLTWNELAAIGPKLARYSETGRLTRPVVNIELDEPTMSAYVGSNKGGLFDLANARFGGHLDSSAAIEAIEFALGLVTKGRMATMGTDVGAFQGGRQAFMTQGPWHIPTFRKGLKFKWGTAQFPYHKVPATTLVEAGWAMGSRSKQKKASWALLSYLGGYHGARAMGETGYAIPAFTPAVKELKLDKDPYFGAFWDGAEIAVPMYRAINPAFMEAWNKMVAPKITKVQGNKLAVDQALRDGAKDADREMARLMPRYKGTRK